MGLFEPEFGKVSGGTGKPQIKLPEQSSYRTLDILAWTLREEHEKCHFMNDLNVSSEHLVEEKIVAGFRYKAAVDITTTAITTYFSLWTCFAPLSFKPHEDGTAEYTVYVVNSFYPRPLRWLKTNVNVQISIEFESLNLSDRIFFKEY